jgi:hypothetical protein
LLAAVVVIAACSGGDTAPRSVAWSWDPCGLAPLQEVAAAFGTPAAAEPSPVDDECRYRVGGVLVRVVVLSDSDTCEGARRTMAALGDTVSAATDAPDGVFVIEPTGDVLVCDPQVTYLLTAEGRSTELIALTSTLPLERSD